jgi:protein involved in polysaccharide export with SLBB domain
LSTRLLSLGFAAGMCVLADKNALWHYPLGCWTDIFRQRTRMSRRPNIPCLLAAVVLTVCARLPAAAQDAQNTRACIGVGDVVQVTIFETSAGGVRADNFVTLPAQTVGPKGTFPVPYAGEIDAAGRSIHEIRREIETKLASRAINPGVVVKHLEQNATGRCFDGLER